MKFSAVAIQAVLLCSAANTAFSRLNAKDPVKEKPVNAKYQKPAPKEPAAHKKPSYEKPAMDDADIEKAKAAAAVMGESFERIVGGQAINDNQFPFYGKAIHRIQS